MFDFDKLRALDEAATPGNIEVRQHTKVSADAKNKALDRVKLSNQIGPLGGFERADGEFLAALWNNRADILAMAEERERSEKHRNDLYDKIMAQVAEIGALKAENRRLREALERLSDSFAGRWAGMHRDRSAVIAEVESIARRALGEENACLPLKEAQEIDREMGGYPAGGH